MRAKWIPGGVAEDIGAAAAANLCLRYPQHFLGFLKTGHAEEFDKQGIDLLLYITGGLILPVQIKAAVSGKRIGRRIAKHQKRYPLVRNLIVLRVPAVPQNELWFKKAVAYAERVFIRFFLRSCREIHSLPPPDFKSAS